MSIERTYVMIKPNGVRRRLVGEIIHRFESRELRLLGLQLLVPTRKIIEAHYHVHQNNPFFQDLVLSMINGPVASMVWEGPYAIRLVRQMVGSTHPLEASIGTIRGDYTSNTLNSLIHASDSPDTADREIALWFPQGLIEIPCAYCP